MQKWRMRMGLGGEGEGGGARRRYFCCDEVGAGVSGGATKVRRCEARGR